MKKYLNYSLAYAIAAMVGGVFYREFAKWNVYTGDTMLGKVHAHLFFLGMLVFMLVALFDKVGELNEYKSFRTFMKLYNIGLPLTVIMMIVRGVIQVLAISLSNGMDAAISGVAGIGHILIGTGIVLLLIALRNSAKSKENNEKRKKLS